MSLNNNPVLVLCLPLILRVLCLIPTQKGLIALLLDLLPQLPLRISFALNIANSTSTLGPTVPLALFTWEHHSRCSDCNIIPQIHKGIKPVQTTRRTRPRKTVITTPPDPPSFPPSPRNIRICAPDLHKRSYSTLRIPDDIQEISASATRTRPHKRGAPTTPTNLPVQHYCAHHTLADMLRKDSFITMGAECRRVRAHNSRLAVIVYTN
jgi:hypothetical protein